MVGAMQFMEALRARQRAGETVRFITMCSAHPDVVGHPGVDVTGADYNWKKRRR
jgi:tagatose-1,6-bisphosphate aldolase non-catalytic subunit AgaZ/GatZ